MEAGSSDSTSRQKPTANAQPSQRALLGPCRCRLPLVAAAIHLPPQQCLERSRRNHQPMPSNR
ncbi:hypothetical protein E2320_002358 [Naja naja]|nr:hypothetical protein E2320_002358 [Naja naja]